MVSFVQDGTTYKETSSQSPQRPFVIVRNPRWVFFVLDILLDVEIPRFPIPLFHYCITICWPALRFEFDVWQIPVWGKLKPGCQGGSCISHLILFPRYVVEGNVVKVLGYPQDVSLIGYQL